MYTAQDAANMQLEDLDRQIKSAVENSSSASSATLRVWDTDWFASTIKEELEKRGFKNISGYDGVHKWDVYFEW